MNIIKKADGCRYDGKKIIDTNITVRITSDEMGKTLSLADENPFFGVMLAIPLESIEKELKKVLE